MTEAPLTLLPQDTSAMVSSGTPIAVWTGNRGAERTVEFLTANIRNPHTRRAYHRAVARFARWCMAHELPLERVQSPHVAAYIEELAHPAPKSGVPPLAALSVKLHLAALKHWCDWLVTGHVLPVNPAAAVRGPRYSQTVGKTPVLEKHEVKALLDGVAADGCDVVAMRDAALIAVMLFSFARVGAVVGMRVRDYRGAGTSSASFVLHEKGGKFHPVPAHHLAAEYLDAYVAASGLQATPDAPLWQSAPRHSKTLSGKGLSARAALDIVKRRCSTAGLPDDICNHSFRATGITLHQDAGGDLEAARQIAGHASVKTTQLYNRAGDKKRRAEVERVQL
jgi:site-specific recombinase XerC